MIFSCKLINRCLDCPNSHIDIRNETVWPSGAITPSTVQTTLYCRHMAVCKEYRESSHQDRIIMIPYSGIFDTDDEDNQEEDFFGGDGINE